MHVTPNREADNAVEPSGLLMKSIANLLLRLAVSDTELDVVDAGDGNRATFPSDRAVWGDFGNHRRARAVLTELEWVGIAGVCMPFGIFGTMVMTKEGVVDASTRKIRCVEGSVELFTLSLLSKPRTL